MVEGLYELLLEQGLTEEDIDQLLAMGELGSEGDILAREQEYVQGLRETPGAQGRGYGRIYRAAHPLEHAASAFQRGYGDYQSQQLAREQMDVARRQTERRGQLLRALGRRAQGVTAPGANPLPGGSRPEFQPGARTTPLAPMPLVPRRQWAAVGEEPSLEEEQYALRSLGY